MKSFYLLLSAALLCGACQSDLNDGVSNTPTNTTSAQDITTKATFAQADGSIKLSSEKTAQGVWQILQKIDPKQALAMGETEITDAQFTEIKTFVDKNLKEEGDDYKTYLNIFQWIVKNVSYAWSGNAYLNPYDVFINKRCVCQGYANLLKTMCITQGIPCFIANGMLSDLGGHAWNYVYVDGNWYVSDPTNNKDYKAANVSGYEKTLIPQRMDFDLFEDEHCVYNYQDGHINVTRVKATNNAELVLPYSIAGFQITSFQPNYKLPDNVTRLYVGANLETFGYYPESLGRYMPNLEEIQIDPNNKELESYAGIVYRATDKIYPYVIPAGIRRVELRPMEIMDKNTVAFLDKVEEIVIANGTVRIEDSAVEACPNLKQVYVPASVTYIDKNAFYNCGDYQIVRFTTGINEVKK